MLRREVPKLTDECQVMNIFSSADQTQMRYFIAVISLSGKRNMKISVGDGKSL